MKLSVVIPTFRRADILKKTLKSLHNQTMPKKDYEIIVVDDGSNDKGATKKVVESFSKKQTKTTYLHQKNQGQGVARNNGIKKAKGEIILLIGDDIIPANNQFLEQHIKFHKDHPAEHVAVLGFTDWHPDLKINHFMKWLTNGSCILGKYGGHQFAYEKLGGGPNGLNSHGKKVNTRKLEGVLSISGHRKQADYNFFYTSNISIKKSLLLKEPFDEEFGKYGWEDIELGYRLTKKHKLTLFYNPYAVGWHDHIITEDTLAPRMKMIAESGAIIDKKYPELHVMPSAKKIKAFKILSSSIVLQLLKLMSTISGKAKDYYYYALSKKYYLKGIQEVSNK